VEGERLTLVGGRVVEFRPRRPWRAGESYAWRISTDVVGSDGARLDEDATGTLSGAGALLLATIAGDDVRDAVARGSAIHVVDGARLRTFEAANPSLAVESAALGIHPTPNRVIASGAGLLISAGSTADYGELIRLSLADPLAPAPSGRLRLSTPAGAPSDPSAAPLPGTPAALAALDLAIAVSNRGVGLQRVELGAFDVDPPPTVPPGSFPPGGAAFADVASAGSLLASVGPAGLQLHDPIDLSVRASAAIDGAATDVDLAELAGRTLALVAAGLSGGVQVYEVAPTDPPRLSKIAKVLPGCAVQRVAADAPMRRAWFACAGTRIGSLDLERVAGLEPSDSDGDGADDRVGGLVSVPVALGLAHRRATSRSSPPARGGASSSWMPRRGWRMVRDPVPGDLGDAESILESGRAFRTTAPRRCGAHPAGGGCARRDRRAPLLTFFDDGGSRTPTPGEACRASRDGRRRRRVTGS
jgi:hypothetical protein